jgi:hypothetical protein
VERDVAAVAEGRGSELIYSGLTGVAQVAANFEKKAALAAAAPASSAAAPALKDSGLRPFDGATFAAPLPAEGGRTATPGGAVARLLEKLKLSTAAAAAAEMSDEDEEDDEIVMRVTVGADGGDDGGDESGSGSDDDADVVQSSLMGTVGGWGSAALSEKDKSTAARAAAAAPAKAAPAAAAQAAVAAAETGDCSSDDSSEDDDSCGQDEGAGGRGLDTSAGIPEGMSKAEWKKKVKEEKREKRKTKVPVRLTRARVSCSIIFVYLL